MALGGGSVEGIQVPIQGDSSGLESALEGGIGKLGDFRTAALGAGAALAGLAAKGLADSVSAAADFEQAMADVEKVTDPQVADDMRGAIMDMAQEIPLAQEELAGLATQAGRMGAEGTEEVAAFTEVAAEMGAATVMSAEDAGTALGKLSSALNEPLSEAGKLGDAINEVSNNFATDSNEIVDAAQRSGQALSQLGLASDEIIGLSGAFNEVSPTSRIAASRMQAVGEAMMDPSNVEMFADALGVTGDQFQNMVEENPQETMFDLLDAVDEGKVSFEELSSNLKLQTARAFRDTAGSADTMRDAVETSNQAMAEGGSLAAEVATETDTAQGQWQLLKNRARNLAIQIGDNLLPYLRDFLAELTKAVDWFAQVNNATDGWAGTISLLVGLVGGLIVAGGSLVSMMGGMAAITGTLTAGFAGVATAIAAVSAPMLALVGVVALLAQAFRTDFGGIRTATERVLGVLREELQPAIQWLQTDAVPIAMAIKDAFVEFASTAEPYVRPLVGLIADGLIWAIRGLFNVVGAVIPPIIGFLTQLGNSTEGSVGRASAAWLNLQTTIQQFVTRVREVLAPLIAWLTGVWQEFNERVLSELALTLQHLAGEFVRFAARIREVLEPLFQYLNAWATRIYDVLTAYFQALHADLRAVWTAMTNALTAVWNVFGDEILAVFEFLWAAITGVARTNWNMLLTIFQTFMQILRGDWEGAWNTITTFLRDSLTRLQEFARAWGDRFLSWLGGLVDAILQWFKDLYHDLVGGSIIPDMFNAIISAAQSFGQAFLSWLGGLVQTFVSKVQAFAQRIIQFYANLFTTVTSAAQSFGSSLLSWLGSLVTSFVGTVRDFIRRVIQFYVGLWSDLLSKASGFGSDFLSWLSGVASDFISGITGMASDAVSEFSQMASDLLNEITSIDLYSAGSSLVGDLASGIRSKISSVKNAAGKVADAVDRYMPGSDAEEGPLSDITDSGPEIPLTIAEGMTDELREVGRAAETVADRAQPALQAEVPDLAGRRPAPTQRTVQEGDTLDIDVVIEGDADRHDVERGLSRALQSYNVTR